MIIRLCAPNDSNGNPQRVYVLLSPDGRIASTWDQAGMGSAAVGPEYQDMANKAPSFATTAEEYRFLVRLGSITKMAGDQRWPGSVGL